MNIGQAAASTGLPARTIRYYEDIGLIAPLRQQNGYREFMERDIDKLRFLQRARGLGFSIESCQALLKLYEDHHRSSVDVKRVALEQIKEVDKKIAELKGLRETLGRLVDACHGDDRPDCPILDELAGETRR